MKNRKRKKSPLAGLMVMAAIIIVLLVIILMMKKTSREEPSTGAGAEQPDPKTTIEAFEKGLDELDVDQVAACFDSASRDAVRENLEEELSQYNAILKMLGFALDFDLEPTNIIYADDNTHCTVSTDVTISAMGKKSSTASDLEMVLEDGAWKIEGENNADVFSEIANMF